MANFPVPSPSKFHLSASPLLLPTNKSQIHSLVSTSTTTTLVQVTIVLNLESAVTSKLVSLILLLSSFNPFSTAVNKLRLLEEGQSPYCDP